MLILNTFDVPGKEIEAISLVKGNIVYSKNVIKDIGAGLKNIVGGELRSYTAMLSEAREIATKRMTEEAVQLNADAIINVRYSTCSITEGAIEIIAYGTAVRFIEN